MFFRILFLCQLITGFVVRAGYEGTKITCVCSTSHCVKHSMLRCNTTGMCFSQYLDRKDGSPPVVRGCISSKTPLLCENRRPAVPGMSWPVLVCCNSNLCNRDVVPTAPSWFLSDNSADQGTESTEDSDLQGGDGTLDVSHGQLEVKTEGTNHSESMVKTEGDGFPNSSFANGTEEETSRQKKCRRWRHPRIVSPVYISVLVLGVFSLIAIGIVATIVLRRNNRFYSEQYGALEHHHHHHHHHHGCSKPRRSVPGTDDLESQPLPSPVLHIYSSKLIGNT